MKCWLIALLLLAAVAACARVMPPPGGVRDTEPPRIVRTEPEQNSNATQHAGTRRPVRIFFHETVSERSPRELVQVSPETGEIDVDRDGEELRVTIGGGWQPGRVYRVTVLPGIVDRMGNARPAAYELVFSTGGTILPNALGGLATDRITGRPVAAGRVEAIARADSTVYTTVTDSAGFFSMRSLPAGIYDTRIYVDQNRNRALDAFEARAISQFTIAPNDTLALELAVLAPDTTPARLVRAEGRDSLQVGLIFDDYMDPPTGPLNIRVVAWQLPDSTQIVGGTVMTVRSFRATRPDTARVTPPGLAAPADTAAALPVNELVWVPPRPLRPSTRYRVTATGYRNLHGLPNGGGSVVFTMPAPPRAAPAAPPDTTRR